MIGVIVIEGDSGSASEQISRVLHKYGETAVILRNSVSLPDNSESGFLVVSQSSGKISCGESSVVVIAPDAAYDGKIPSCSAVIAGIGCENAMKLLVGVDSQIITVGTSPRATLSLSGVTGNNASVSVQRSIHQLHGAAGECELQLDSPFELSGADTAFSLLAAAGVLIFAGILPCGD